MFCSTRRLIVTFAETFTRYPSTNNCSSSAILPATLNSLRILSAIFTMPKRKATKSGTSPVKASKPETEMETAAINAISVVGSPQVSHAVSPIKPVEQQSKPGVNGGMKAEAMDQTSAKQANTTADPTQPCEITEGKATVISPPHVFYNPVQEFNRDLTISVISEFASEFAKDNGFELPNAGVKCPSGIRILEALGASGLRSVRFGLEIPGVSEIVCNDFDSNAVQYIHQNVQKNAIGHLVTPSHSDAALFMYQCKTSNENKYDVIDLDPYGSPSIFLDAAVQAIRDGGLLCVTATDMAVMAGNFGETAFTKYGSYAIRTKACHEMALRILLHSIESHATKYSRYIKPVLAVSVDFYIRVFVRVHEGQGATKFSASKRGMIYQCTGCGSMAVQPLGYSIQQEDGTYKHTPGSGPPVNQRCDHCGERHKVTGPVWIAPIHDKDVVENVFNRVHELIKKEGEEEVKLGTARRIQGMMKMVHEEVEEVPLYYMLDDLCKTLHCMVIPANKFRSAILNAGYDVSYSHANKNSVKTNAPVGVLWDILRQWVKINPVSQKRLNYGGPAKAILEIEPKLHVSFDAHNDVNPESREKGLLRFQMNPQKDWGPKSKARLGASLDISTGPSKAKKRRMKKMPCKFIQKGEECTDGEECLYSHDPEVIKNYVPFTKKFPCKKLATGSCSLTEVECKYSHTIPMPVKDKSGETKMDENFTEDVFEGVLGQEENV